MDSRSEERKKAGGEERKEYTKLEEEEEWGQRLHMENFGGGACRIFVWAISHFCIPTVTLEAAYRMF